MRSFLRVHTGPMFSGKSSSLLTDVSKYSLSGKKVKLFKPLLDNRKDDKIHTHLGAEVQAINLNHIKDIYNHLDYSEDIVGIDEMQFFQSNEDVREVINDLLHSNFGIVVAGLDMDCFGRPFGCMPLLMSMADEVFKYKAVCTSCGEPANFEFRKENNDDNELVVIGGSDRYEPLCRECFNKRMKRL